MPWYKTGTVKVTNNSNAILGAGTAFISNSRVGDAFRGPDGAWYEVTNIASDTAISISPHYQGSTVVAGTYALVPMQGYVKDSADQLRAATSIIGSTATDMSGQVASALAAAAAAKESRNSATSSATSAGQSKTAAATSEAAATTAKNQTVQSASQALVSKNEAKTSETNAATSAAKAEAAAGSVANKASSGANKDITSLSGLTTPLSVTQGGTGGNTQALGRAGLGLGTASTATLTTSVSDHTVGRALKVGDGGWMGNPVNRNTLASVNAERGSDIFYSDVVSAQNPFPVRGSGIHIKYPGTGMFFDLFASISGAATRLFARAASSATAINAPVELYHTGNLSTASESVAGIAKRSTSEQATGGSDNTTLMTPLRVKEFVDSSVNTPKAYVRFGLTGAIIEQFNVSSVVRNGPGDFTLKHTRPLPSSTRPMSITGSVASGMGTGAGSTGSYWGPAGSTATQTRVSFYTPNGNAYADPLVGMVIIY